jgi:6-phosphogluconate dehydrogenase
VVALDLGIPLTLISEAVFARCLSAQKDERVEASKILPRVPKQFKRKKQGFLADLERALYASKIVSYTQGFVLLHEAAKEYHWNLNYGGIATLWRGGCIIRSVFLAKIKEAFDANPQLSNLLVDPFFKKRVERSQKSWRRVVSAAVLNGVWIPAFSTALSYYDGFRSGRLPANLLQAQRDYFGAHQYERIDKPRGQFFHTNWTGHGGGTASSSYTV